MTRDEVETLIWFLTCWSLGAPFAAAAGVYFYMRWKWRVGIILQNQFFHGLYDK